MSKLFLHSPRLTTAWCLPARFHDGKYCDARLPLSDASTIRGIETSLVECRPRLSAIELLNHQPQSTVVIFTDACSATISLSRSADRSSSSRLCRRTVARPFSISCSAILLLISQQIAETVRNHLRVLTSVCNRDTFPFIIVPILRLYVVDVDVNMLSNQAFPQEPAVRSVIPLNSAESFTPSLRLPSMPASLRYRYV